jgi:hypothetical protein
MEAADFFLFWDFFGLLPSYRRVVLPGVALKTNARHHVSYVV